MKKPNLDHIKEEAERFELEQADLKRESALLKSNDENKAVKRRNEILLREIQKLEGKIKDFESVDFSKYRPHTIVPKLGSGKSESTVIACASDWHVGERVDAETVNGVNEFNPAIAKIRADNFFKKIMVITGIFRGSTRIKDLVLWLGGDFISGYIHEELMESNYLSPSEEIEYAYSLLVSGIDSLLEHGGFETVTIPCSVGNHGRTGIKMRVSTSYANSFEAMLYTSLARKYENEKRVKMVLTKSYHNIVDVYGKRIRFHHGDSLKYQGGVGGLTVPTLKAIAKWNQESKCDLDIFGHYHQLFYGGQFLCNGSLVGYGAYSKSIKASFEKPSQGIIVMEKEKGMISFNPAYLD